MANTEQPYRRIGTNSWKELLDQVNEKLENPPEDTDCEPLEPIEEPEEDHKWAKSDIEEVHNRLDEMPGNCFVWEPIPNKWKLSIIENIEEQLGNAWCDCEEEGCLDECSNAQSDSVETYLGSWNVSACHNCGALPDCPGCEDSQPYIDMMDQAREAGGRAVSAMGDWDSAYVEYCALKEEVEDLEDELERLEEQLSELQQYQSEVCAIPDNEAACEAAQQAVDDKQQEIDDKQEEIDEKTEERDEKQTEADDYLSEAESAAGESMGYANSACGVDYCGSCLTGSAGSQPCVDYECDQLGPECLGKEATRCCVRWHVQRKTTKLAPFYWEGSWSTTVGGGYTPSGQPYVTSGSYPPCIPAFACSSCGYQPCKFGCHGAVYLYEARLIQSFPYATGEICCDQGGPDDGGGDGDGGEEEG